ncbi:unnamed protein product [Ilex paraguariensis]|uniref:Plus3 domain-containing protein n=1 Tax=Ilex paraguariensis TaxID=185542 RepID=A0ABC8TEU1_9AQUA
MRNVDNVEIDLGLALGYSNHRTRLNNDSGAGVNAGSRVDMTFVVPDPLSELVWCPCEGLSLKCADCSLVERKPSLLRDVGPGNMIRSPMLSIKSMKTTDNKPIGEDSVIMSKVAFSADDGVSDKASLANSHRGSAATGFGSSHERHSGAGGKMEEINTVEAVSVEHFGQKEECITDNECIRDNEEKCLSGPNNIQIVGMADTNENNADHKIKEKTNFLPPGTNESRPGMAITEPLSWKCDKKRVTDHGSRIEEIAGGTQKWASDVALASENPTVKQYEPFEGPLPEMPSPGSRHKELDLVIKDVNRNQMTRHGSTSDLPTGKVEFTSENDLCDQICKYAHGQKEERSPVDKSVSLEASATNSRVILCQRKGKEKAISDGDSKERISKDEDNSHESAESCNTAGLFTKGKKRWSFEQPLVLGSKRIKKGIQDSPASTSHVRQDSSFMNWIANMVKGLAKSNQDEVSPFALSLAHPNLGHESHDQKVITCGNTNMGFQTIFQSLYCTNPKAKEARMSNDTCSTGEPREVVLAGKTYGAEIAPIPCCGENDKFLVPDKKFDKSTFANGEGLSTQPSLFSENNVAWETSKLKFSDNNNSGSLAYSKAKKEVCSSGSSLSKRKTCEDEKTNSDPQSEGKAIHNMGFGSLWITRFSPKKSSSMSNLDTFNQSTHGAVKCSPDYTRLVPNTQSCADFSTNPKSLGARGVPTEGPVSVVGKELQNHAPSMEASFGFKRISGNNCQKSICEVNHILRSPKLKSLEAMTSVFARRLDALKHFIPSAVKDDAICATTTCFFCGRNGHDLRGCSEIREAESVDLLRNFSQYDGPKESSCLCIRCFQHDHWAITCPLASSSRQEQSKNDASLTHQQSSSKVQLCIGVVRQSGMLETRASHPQVAGEHSKCSGKKRRIDGGPSRKTIYEGKISSSEEVQGNTALGSREKELEENHSSSLCKFGSKQISDVPKGMFDAIRGLHLSRMDILKLVKDPISLLHLDGFFLRLRLGKWEEGLGGTGYYVACITGVHRENSAKNSQNSISVNVGGIKCIVENQHISNHDFLEDELVAWWCRTLRSGGTIPSVNDLKLKLDDRKKLGL